MIFRTVLYALICAAVVLATDDPTTTCGAPQAADTPCTAGCYLSDNGTCLPVEPGYYSPSGDNKRHLCEPGTFSNQMATAECTICPAGSVSGPGNTECTLCPPGFYQEESGKSVCKHCTPGYSGAGSNNFIYDAEASIVKCRMESGVTSDE